MITNKSLANLFATGAAAAVTCLAATSDRCEATVTEFVVTSTTVNHTGVGAQGSFVVYTLWARCNGPTDTVLNAFNFGAVCGSSLDGFWHKDNAYYNSGALMQEFGTWNPSQTGSTVNNRPFDSYITIGNVATPTNTTNADPSWVSGGNADARSWNRPDVPSNGTCGWFNSNPPNNQGRVGLTGNTATDVRIGQFVLSPTDAQPRTYTLTLGYNNGIAGSQVQFFTGTFSLGNPAIPSTWYRDLDGDGFGSAASGTTTFCTQPAGYVSNNADCNDAALTYIDADADTFGSTVLAACGATNNADCNDADAAINPNTIWSRDLDGDGIGSSGDGTLVQCAQPAGYVLQGNDNCPTIANADQADCNGNAVGDVCEIAQGALGDCDSDSIPDICEGGTVVNRVSPLLAPFGSAAPVNYTFGALLPSFGGNVRLHIDAIADLDLSSEFIAVSFDGGAQEFFFVADGRDCPATPDRATRTFTNAAFNALVADGNLSVSVVASGTVSATQCPTGGIRLTLEYTGLGSGSDCNGNFVLDSCELGNGLAFDCNGNGVLDSCDVTAGLGTDCNANGKLDSCDLASGASTDLNGNGVLDECAGEWIVGGSGFATIQEAIDAAPADTVIRVGRGTFAESLTIDSKRIVLLSIDGLTTLSGTGLGTSIVQVLGAGAAGTYIEGFTFRNGSVGAPLGQFRVGGAIALIDAPSVTVSGCTFVQNHSDYGGAIYCIGGSGLISDCIFSGNTATNDGGALEIGNATGWTVRRCQMLGNSAPLGAGMHLWSAGVTILDTQVVDNMASQTGGGVSWYSPGSSGVLVDGCTIEGNAAPSGGGLARIAGSGAFDVLRTRFCRNLPENIAGNYNDLGQNIFSQDCDADGVCDDIEISDTASTSFVWSTESGGNGRRYLRLSTAMSWEAANARAQALGGHLATVNSAAEQAFLASSFSGVSSWLGGSQPAGSAEPDSDWAWVTGEPWSFTAWTASEPNDSMGEDRLIMLPNGQWNDSGCPGSCFYPAGAIVEITDAAYNRSRDCNGNGIPDGCDLDSGVAADCNGNSIPDSCDIAAGLIADCNANGLADECELGRTTAWGEGNFGQTTIPAAANFARQVVAGCNHALALRPDGTIIAWGSNTFGQTTVPSSVVDARAIAAGCDHNLALLADDSVVAWGYNAYGQCNVPQGANGSVAQIAAGANHSAVRKADGSLVLWGRNIDGECTVPPSLGAAASIALGGAHTVALRADGSAACWGLNNFGQCTVPASVGVLQSVAAGCYHTVGLRQDGTVVAWGSNIFGQTSVPAGLNGVTAISAGSGQHTLAIRSNGQVVAWGWNAFNQASVPGDVAQIGEIAAGGTFSVARRTSSVDCNGNGAIDSCELADGSQPDCNGNGVIDACDIAGGTVDCNANGIPDACELAAGTQTDCNANGTLDSCDIASGAAFDCNANGRLDSCDVASGFGTDCNANGKLDSCDLASGTSTDLNGNGVLDECAGEFVVGGSGFSSVAAAVAAAPAGATIQVGPGTYTGAISITDKPLTLVSLGGPAVTVLSGTGLDSSILTVRNAAANGTTIDGFTFRDGSVGTAEFNTRLGGAMLLIQTSGTIRNCRFLQNTSTFGGAIYALNFSGTIEECIFDGNHAIEDAGAIQLGFGGTFVFRNNQLLDNSSSRHGGAMQVVQWLDGPSTTGSIVGCTFRGNTATQDGGALNWFAAGGGNLPVVGCTVESNSSSTAVFHKSLSNAVASLAFDIAGSRFCLNPSGNVDGPIVDGGNNVFSQDCNGNGLCDSDEILAGTATDCDSDGFPDSCQLGSTVAWGESTSGQTTIPANLGAPIAISAGCNHALALKRDGTIAAWGANNFGQHGVAIVSNAVAIAAGCDHSLAARADGAVFASGYNAFGQCNVPAAALGNVAQLAAGANHSGVRKNDGSLVLWGRNIDGECNVPPTLGPAVNLALGGAHSVALRADGSVACWGLNNFGQCTVPGNVGVLKDIAAGCYHTVGLRTNGTVIAWGSSIFGQTTVPAGLTDVVDIAAGSGQHSLALQSDGTVTGWGWNAFGQSSPPFTLTNAFQIAAGGTFSMGVNRGSGDCDNSGGIDSCEIASGASADCNGNAIPDACDLAAGAADCNNNGKLDSCELAAGEAFDCNGNGRPDSCDLALGSSTDLNGNLVPDECAGEWVVGGTGFRTIQAAITAAPTGTTIRVGPGTYTGSILLDGKAITLVSLGGPSVTTLSGLGANASTIALRTAAANGSVIDGFTFRDGMIGTAAFNVRVGGALFLDGCTGTVRNCRFEGNSCEYGGAIYAINFSGVIEDCVFLGNSATYNSGAVQIGFGGTVAFRRNLVENNSAAGGGGLHVVNWDDGPITAATIADCVFRGNTASESGGALLWYGATGADLSVMRCTVESNTAPDAAFARAGGTLAFDIVDSRFCLNAPANFAGPVDDLGGNTFSQDCNRNGVCDADEIASGSESDCNANGIPDSCELSGTLFAFGDNARGQIDVPASLGRPLQIAAGCDHSLVLMADGTLRAWGQNSFGQGTVPAGLSTVSAIAAGCDHNLARLASGAVVAWGYNAYGQCNVPSGLGDVADLAAGANHSGIRRTNGTIALWGRNIDGECNVPGTLGAAAQLALGGAHSVARRADGSVVCWGLNNFGQCNVPSGVGTLQSIAAGCYHTVGLRGDGTVVAWGSALFGQTQVPAGLSGVVAIAAGSGQHTVALKSNGTVVAWGWNAFGQSQIPSGATDIIRISAGGAHTLLLSRPAPDCNGNGALDSCEIAANPGADCNGNATLDACELASGAESDCDNNGRLDSCDLAAGAPDCNGNARPDTCDLASGSSSDLNSTGIPDECEFVVGGTGYASIQAAITAAPDGTTIEVAPGSWSPIAINGRSLILESIAGPAETFIDGANAARAVTLANIQPRGVRIVGFTIRNGAASDGAGIKLTNAAPTIVDCVITENIATGAGGGIGCTSSSPLFQNCTIVSNSASQGGGAFISGVAAGGTFAQFDLCVISANDAAGAGGGLYNSGLLLLTGSTLEFNQAGAPGGALFTVSGATSAVGDSYFCLNAPNNVGGAPFTDLTGNVLGEDCNSNGICDIDEIAGGAEDKNQNNQLDACELARGDLNLDGVINAADLSVLLNFWGAQNPPAGDLNRDGVVSAADLSIMLNNWRNN